MITFFFFIFNFYFSLFFFIYHREVKERAKTFVAKKKVVPKTAAGGKGIIPKHQNPGYNARGGSKL